VYGNPTAERRGANAMKMSRIGSTLRLWFGPERRAWRGHMPLATVFWGNTKGPRD
jgi:hypothetical protein